MNKLIFKIKKAYNNAIDRIMSATDKIDYALVQIDEHILKYGEARTACLKAGLDDKVKLMEDKIRDLDKQRRSLQDKRDEYEAKIKCLEAQLEAQKVLVGLTGNTSNYTSITKELDNYIKHLEAELNTMELISNL